MAKHQRDQRCGHVALIGLPNAGKSTLMNAILGTKISIVSHKPQTTRFQVVGIHLAENDQIIFLDTPGMFQPGSPFEKNMLQAAWQAVYDCAVIVLLVDVKEGASRRLMQVIENLKEKKLKVVAVINKIDLVKKEVLLDLAQCLHKTGIVSDIFMISALKNDGVGDFVRFLRRQLPYGPWFYDEDQLTNLPEKIVASEITREKLFDTLNQEIPYDLMVETERWENHPDGSVKIYQNIYVKRDTQKAIILGRMGKNIKRVGEKSRLDIGEILQRPVHLFLHVKVDPKWHTKPHVFQEGHFFQA